MDMMEEKFLISVTEKSTLFSQKYLVPRDITSPSFWTAATLQLSPERCTVKGPVRGIKPMPRAGTVADMLEAADKSLRDLPGYRSVLAEDWFPNMDSHVILAACKEYEFAREVKRKDGYHGIFTQALTRALQSAANETTYIGLLQALPATVQQTPVIAGKHRNARLWYQVRQRLSPRLY